MNAGMGLRNAAVARSNARNILLGSALALGLTACGVRIHLDPDSSPTPTLLPPATATAIPNSASIAEEATGATVVAAPAPTQVSTLTPTDSIPPAEFRVLAIQHRYGIFIESWSEMVDRGTGGKIAFMPRDTNEPEAVEFIRLNRQEYDADGVGGTGLIFLLGEDHVPLWDAAEALGISPREAAEQKMNFTDGLVVEPRPQNLWTSFPAACMNWYSLAPDIRSIHDLEGKRVYMGQPGNTDFPLAELLTEAAGIRGTFDEITGGIKPAFEMLADRDVDVTAHGINFAGHPLSSATPQIYRVAKQTGSLFNVDTPLDVIERARTNNPEWANNGLLPPAQLHRGDLSREARLNYDMIRAEEEWCTGALTGNFMTSPYASEAVIYHMVRSVVENIDLADAYFPFMSLVWKERLAHTWNPQSSFHPGARRAYEELGVTYGIEGIREWEETFDRDAFIRVWEARG